MKPCLHIAFYIPGLPFGPDSLTTQSLGGSETAGLSMATELANRGHRVFVFCNQDKPAKSDNPKLQFLPVDDFARFVTFMQHDVTVVQRVPQMLRNRMLTKLSVAWMHDMALVRHNSEFMSAMWNVDQVALLSKYMIDQYRDVYGEKVINDDIVWQTRNGIDLSLFPGEPAERNPKLLVYSARPERGLDYLLERIMPKLLQRDPQIRLAVCGYDNPASELDSFYQHCNNLAAKMEGAVQNVGHQNKPDLYKLYARAGAYVYPTPSPANPRFREISCITAMECMASGLPFVGSRAGALPETLAKGAGTLIDGIPGDEKYDERFVDAVLKYVNNQEAHRQAGKKGQRAARACTWASVAEEWEQRFVEKIEAKNSDSERLSLYFRKRGDLAILGEQPAMLPPSDSRSNADPYQSGVLYRWLKESGAKTVLDFGTMPDVAKQLPDCEWHSKPKEGQLYDAVMLVNRLEYEPKPWTVLEYYQNYLTENGWVMAVTPFGPHRLEGRIWDLETSDIEDMVSHCPRFDLFAYSQGSEERTAEPIGLTYFKFQKGETVKPVDLERKKRLQAPKETLSVNIIAGGETVHHLLHWTLSSVEAIADEIVIGDTGMTEEARRIANQYEKVRIIEASNPLEHGFETPRNEVLEASRMDWVLWIDTDEHLVGGDRLTKYLRPSVYDGYSIKQHHKGIGIDYEPDMPVRIFRRNGQIRFFGMIHEHPEQALNEGPGMVVVISDVDIIHYGYEDEITRHRRFWRNLPLLEKDKEAYPERLLQKHFIMRDNMILAHSEINQHGGKMTEKAKELCEQTIELWRTYFKEGCPLVNIDSTQYYNAACQLLGIGVDVNFEFQAGKDGYGATNGTGRRYANEDDLLADLKERAKKSIQPYLHEHW